MVFVNWLRTLSRRCRQFPRTRRGGIFHNTKQCVSSISPSVDLLEERVLLSVVPVLSGRTVTFTGDGAADSLSLRATPEGVLQFSTDGSSYSSDLGGSTTLTVTAGDAISVNLGAGSDTFTVDASLSSKLTAVGATLTHVGGGDVGDRLVGPNQENNWDITGDGAGTLGAITFSGVKNLTGGTGADSFDFSGVSSAVMTIDAGRGDNTCSRRVGRRLGISRARERGPSAA